MSLDSSCSTFAYNNYSTTLRTSFVAETPQVRGFPSTGGILMLPLDPAVAAYLSVPRLTTAMRAPDPTAEDEFCTRLRLLGAKWWESEDAYVWKLIERDTITPEERRELIVGWPSLKGEGERGVWVLRAESSSKLPKDFAMLQLCLNMDERCELLKRWGAIFYEDPATVDEFKTLLLE